MTDDDKAFEGFIDFMSTIHDVEATEYPAIVERIYEGAVMEGMTMVEWIMRAINIQFVRDVAKKGEREGTLVWNGTYRNREPVFVHVSQLGERAN